MNYRLLLRGNLVGLFMAGVVQAMEVISYVPQSQSAGINPPAAWELPEATLPDGAPAGAFGAERAELSLADASWSVPAAGFAVSDPEMTLGDGSLGAGDMESFAGYAMRLEARAAVVEHCAIPEPPATAALLGALVLGLSVWRCRARTRDRGPVASSVRDQPPAGKVSG